MPNRNDLAGVARPICGSSGEGSRRNRPVAAYLVTVFVLALSAFVPMPALAADIDDAIDDMQLHRYWDALDEYKAKGYKPAENVNISLDSTKYSAAGPGALVSTITEIGGRKGKFLKWDATPGEASKGWMEWKVTVPQSGLYNLSAEYYPISGQRSAIQRGVLIDGVLPFYESKVEFKRIWVNQWGKTKDERIDNQGNDIRPKQVEKPAWRTEVFQDIERIYEWPLQYYMSAGEHTIRLEYVREPIVLGELRVTSPEALPTYAELKKAYEAKGYKPVTDVSFKIQAERTFEKSDPTMRPEYGGDALNEPAANGNMKLNEFGSWRWRNGGEWASWTIKAPKDGLYQIGFREWQGWDQKPSVRSIKIDGKLPFKEANEIFHPYQNLHQILFVPSDNSGNPYLFYLTKGTHTLELEVRVGPYRETLRTLYGVIKDIGRMARKIVMVTGPDPDPNTEWELDKNIPELIPTLRRISKELDEQVVHLTKISKHRPIAANSLAMVADQLRDIANDPETIAARFDQFSTSQSSLSTWLQNLRWHPLIFDWIWVAGPNETRPRAIPTAWERTASTFRSFLISFKKDYTGVGSVHKGKDDKIIDVWIGRGREWAEIIKNMLEDDFTPKTGIKVNMNILPVGDTQTMLLSSISGRAPDVAMGVPSTIPVDFAIRGALEKLNQFPDYKEVAKRFRPGSLIPYNYQGGNWAVPEDQDFIMMYYRTDILNSLGIKKDDIPKTWDEVYKLLPVLQQAGLEFYFPQNLFAPFLFQRGGDYYTKDGLKSALGSPAALKAFEEWTDLYTKYKIQKQANFFNRMRTGEMPIGVEGYGFYLTLSTAAPELTGWWEMVPLPGIKQADGTINRSVGGGSSVSVIFKNPRNKKDPKRIGYAWEFIKWWSSTEAQVRYGSEIKSLLGPAAMWNSANYEALLASPWPEAHRAAINEQWKWFKEAPYVVGGYFSTRHIDNAWNRVVLEGMNPREALELSVEDIDKELERKQEEFSIAPKTGKKKKSE